MVGRHLNQRRTRLYVPVTAIQCDSVAGRSGRRDQVGSARGPGAGAGVLARSR
jgi:hypothetical protein